MVPQGCYGCKFARGEITYAKGHNGACWKRFLELSETPGNEELKSKINKSIEKATRKLLETQDPEETEDRGKRSKTQDARSQSKQNQSQGSRTETKSIPENKGSSSTEVHETSGTKRTSSKVAPTETRDYSDEPDAKRVREDESTDMNDAQHIEVYEFYSMPRIAPRTIGKNVKKSASFDINTNDEEGNSWNFMKAERRQKAREHVRKNKPLFIIGSHRATNGQ